MAFQMTTGLGTPTQVNCIGNTPGLPVTYGVVLSLSNTTYPSTFQLNPSIVDVSGASQTAGTAFTLTSVVAATPAPYTLTAVAASTTTANVTTAVYTGTITSGGSNAYAGRQFVVTGFAGANNNGTFQCTASSTTLLTLTNTAATAETHAGAAQDQTSTAAYTGTITSGGSNAFRGLTFVVAGFTTAANNGTFYCSGSSTTVLTLDNPAALAETHAATATGEETTAVTYWSSNPAQVTVSAGGLLTAVALGVSVVEVSYPTFNNSVGAIVAPSNVMNGLPAMKIFREMNVHVRV